MGDTKTQHFYDLGIFESVAKPQTQPFFIFGDARTPKTNQENISLQYFYTSRNFETPKFRHCSRRRAPKNDEDPSQKISKSLDMGPISS